MSGTRLRARLEKLEKARPGSELHFVVCWHEECMDEGPWSQCRISLHGPACRVGRSGRHVIALGWE
jgi:hypothetical protein